MENEALIFGRYLKNPEQIKIAIDNLNENSKKEMSFVDRYKAFESDLKIDGGDGLPITAIELEGPTIRARVNELGWNEAKNISEIGVNPNATQGRAHALGYHIFYGANRKKTAVFEVLQNKKDGLFEVTIGIWKKPNTLRLVNFVDKTDETFIKLAFAHSDHKNYLKFWPELEKQSATLLIDFFKDKFKQEYSKNLYNITNVLAGICFSLRDIDGIGYASISDSYEGFNVALRNYSDLKCIEAERWRILIIDRRIFSYQKIKNGSINENGDIQWINV